MDTRFAPISVWVRTSLATEKVRWNSLCSKKPSVPACFGLPHRLLHLPENLRFAQHHRIQSAGHAERMLHCLLALQRVQIGVEILAGQVVVLRQPVDGLLGLQALQYSSVRLQVDRIAASFAAPFSTRLRRAFSIPSTLNATCSRTASGAV